MPDKRKFAFHKDKYLAHQWQFLQSKTTRLALVTGYGGGKTFIFIRKCFNCMISMLDPKTGLSNGWVLYPTFDLAEELFVTDFLDLLERLAVPYDYNISKHRITTPYGKIRLFSMQKPQRIVGGNLTWVGADEMDVENTKTVMAVYQKAVARLRGCDDAPFFTVSTLEGYKAVYDIFYTNASPDKELITASTRDNPHNPAGYVDSLMADYDSLMQQMYIDGKPVNLNGSAAYYAFKRDLHLKPCKDLDVKDAGGQYYHQLWIGMDFNVQPMTASARIMVDGDSYQIREYWLSCGNTRTMCQNIREDYPDRPIIVCPDMTGDHNTTNAFATDFDILREYGFQIQGYRNLLQKDRLNIVNNAYEKGKVYHDPSCKHTITDRERVILIDNHIDKSEEKAPNYRTHMPDADDYCLVQQLHKRAAATQRAG